MPGFARRPAGAARRHAIPSTFWPGWTARLLPPQEQYPRLRGPALAASLLPAGTRLTHAEAAGFLGSVITHWTVTTTLQRLHAAPQWNDICTALTSHLDTQPAAIDYERRRHLDYASLLPDAEWEDIRLRTERAHHPRLSRRLAHTPATSDAIQALLLDHPAPAEPAGGARRRRTRYAISREQLWDLHHGQRLTFTEIGQRTGYSRTAIRDLARTYEIPRIHRDGSPLKALSA